MPRDRKLRIKHIRVRAEHIVELELEDPSGAKLESWSPGAHIDLLLPSGLVRQYSLCNDTPNSSNYRIAVLREKNGRGGSSEVHNRLKAGMSVTIRGPRNNFHLVNASNYLMIAGGIGITPIISMVSELKRLGKNWTLFYGGRSLSSMAYIDELRNLSQESTNFFPQDEVGLLDIEKIFSGIEAETAIYCCGPEPLLSAVSRRAPWPDRLFMERFSAPIDEKGDSARNTEFTVELRRSGFSLIVPTSRSLLDVIREALPDVASSCEEGYCGTCLAKVLEGVPDHRDSFLTEKERQDGKTIMLCVGRSKTPNLVLDL